MHTPNLALYFIILSFPQPDAHIQAIGYYLLLTIASISSITYLYHLYQFVKKVSKTAHLGGYYHEKKTNHCHSRNLSFTSKALLDECRQEIIYKACARSMVQIVYSSFFLFLFYPLFGRFIEAVHYAMPYVYSGLIFHYFKNSKERQRTPTWKR